MSPKWIDDNIDRYIISSDLEIREIGKILEVNRDKLGRAVSAIDKFSQELLILFIG